MNLAHSLLFLPSQCTLSYFMADLVWVARVPICVKSPGVIIKVRRTTNACVRGGGGHPSRTLHRHMLTIHSFTPLSHCIVASHCRHVLLDVSSILARISDLFWFHFVGRNQHLFLDCSTNSLQAIVEIAFTVAAVRLYHVFCNMDLDPLLSVSCHVGRLLVHGSRSHPVIGPLRSLGNDLHCSSCCPLCVKCPVDLRFIQAHRSAMAGDWTKNCNDSKWIVRRKHEARKQERRKEQSTC